jgi:hypothetical protein
MSDLWEDQLHVASFAGLELDVLSVDDESGRAVAIRRSPYRDGARVEDLGGEARVTRCQVIFFQRGPSDHHLARFADFENVKRLGEVGTFVHPLTGSYDARITAFSFSAGAEPRDVIMVQVTFTEDTDEPAVFDIGAGAPRQSMAEDVAIAAAGLDEAIAEVAFRDPDCVVDRTVATDAVAVVSLWESPTATIRDVNLKVVALRNRIEAEMFRLELATDVRRYPILRALNRLEATLRQTATVFTERAPRIVEHTITAPTNLLSFCASRFGAVNALDRYDELRTLNDVRNPARLDAGTVLKAQSARSRTRRVRSPR